MDSLYSTPISNQRYSRILGRCGVFDLLNDYFDNYLLGRKRVFFGSPESLIINLAVKLLRVGKG